MYEGLRTGMCIIVGVAAAAAADPVPTVAGAIGGAGVDEFFQVVILSNGQTVMQGRLNSGTLPVTPVLVAGAAATSPHVLVKFAADGRTIVAAARLPGGPTGSVDGSPTHRCRMGLGSNDVLWVGSSGGVLCLNADFSLRWQSNGYAMVAADGDYGTDGATVWNANGVVQGTLSAPPNPDGGLQTRCIAIDGTNRLVFVGGYRQTYGNNSVDVQVPWVQAQTFTGTSQWVDYNWPGLTVDPAGMADTRAVQMCIGEDRKLYVAFHVEGGNTPLNFQPQVAWGVAASSVGGGSGFYHMFANTDSDIKVGIGRYTPTTGALEKMQYLTGRRTAASGIPEDRRVAATQGGIAADAAGNVYLVGDTQAQADPVTLIYSATTGHYYDFDASFNLVDLTTNQIVTEWPADLAWIPSTPTGTVLPYTTDLVDGRSTYGGGGFLAIFNSSFAMTSCLRLLSGQVATSGRDDGNATAARAVAVRGGRIAMAGIWYPPDGTSTLWTAYPVQSGAGVDGDAWYAIHIPGGNQGPVFSKAATAAPPVGVLP